MGQSECRVVLSSGRRKPILTPRPKQKFLSELERRYCTNTHRRLGSSACLKGGRVDSAIGISVDLSRGRRNPTLTPRPK